GGGEWMEIRRQDMMDRRRPSGRERQPLIVGDRDQRHVLVFGEYELVVRQVETTVRRGHRRPAEAPHERKMQVVRMEVQNVEFTGTAPDLFELEHAIGRCVPNI